MKNMQQIKTGNISEGIEFIQTTELEEETKEYIKKVYENTGYEAYPHSDANTLNRSEGFKDGVKSDAARDYWYAQFQQEQKQELLEQNRCTCYYFNKFERKANSTCPVHNAKHQQAEQTNPVSDVKEEPQQFVISIKKWNHTDKFPCPNCGKRLSSPYLCTDCNIKIKPVINFNLKK